MSKAYLADISDLQLERLRLRRRNAKNNRLAHTEDGKVIPVRDMTDEHLHNTIAMISRKRA